MTTFPIDAPVVVILRVRDAGGPLTLLGLHADTGWRFARERAHQTRRRASVTEANHASDWIDNWTEALAEFSRSPWWRMRVVELHPEFKDRVWSAVWEQHARRALIPETLERWIAFCDVI